MTWPIGMGKRFKGVYHLYEDTVHIFSATHGGKIMQGDTIKGLDNPELDALVGDQADELREEIELVKGASHEFDLDAYLAGTQTPVFFGSAINNFGILELLDALLNMRQHLKGEKLISVLSVPRKRNFPALYLKFRPIWIHLTVTELHSYGSVPESLIKA